MAFVALMYYGFAFLYQEISLPVFLGLEGVESRSIGSGRHRAWSQSLAAYRRPLETEPLSLESHACCTYLLSNNRFSIYCAIDMHARLFVLS